MSTTIRTHWYQRAMWKALRIFRCPTWQRDYNVTADIPEHQPDPPFVLVGNHAHKLDPYFAGTFSSAPVIHYMANIDGVSPVQQRLAHLVAAYPKKKGVPDLGAVRQTIALTRAGSAVGIFPEGDRSWDGETQEIHPGTAALIARLDIPIVLVHFQGHYLSWPRWADYPSRGMVHLSFEIISREKIRSMTPTELHLLLSEKLYQNDIKDPEVRSVPFVGEDRIAGIQRVAWMCPVCRCHDTIQPEKSGDHITCTACSSQWTVGNHLEIAGPSRDSAPLEDLKDWMDWQRGAMEDVVLQALNTGGTITSTPGVQLYKRSASSRGKLVLNHQGTGNLVLTSTSLELRHEESGTIIHQFPAQQVMGFIDNFNQYAEFVCGGERWRLVLGSFSAHKWIETVATLNRCSQP